MIEQIKAERAEPAPKPDPQPWRRHDDPVPEGVTVDFYQDARIKLELEPEHMCAGCGGKIGASRVTDGGQS